MASVSLTWGMLDIKLLKSGQNNYIGFGDVALIQASNLGKIGFQLFDEGKEINKFSERHLYYRSNKSTENLDLRLQAESNRLTDQEFVLLLNKLSVNDGLICYLKSLDGITYTVFMNIKPDQIAYNQPLAVVPFNKSTHFKYQLVTKLDGNQVLKLDTSLQENKAVMNAYSKMNKVRIQHFSNFETTINFLSELDSIVVLGKRNLAVHPVNKPNDNLLISVIEPKEITEASLIYMDWNRMVAKPDSPVFSVEFLKAIKNHMIHFYEGSKKYEIVSMRFTYYNGKKLNKSYYWDNKETFPLDDIKTIDGHFSIIFDRIILKDSKLGYIYVPQPFIFNFQ